MNSMKWMKWFFAGLLAVGCALAMSACGGGDDGKDNGGGVVVVTNVVGGTTVVVTNVPVLVAPQLVTPADNTTYSTLLLVGMGYKVNFEWTAVAGATSYVLELNGAQTPVAGTTATLELGYNTYNWRVWAKNASGAGPASGKFKFIVKSSMIVIPMP